MRLCKRYCTLDKNQLSSVLSYRLKGMVEYEDLKGPKLEIFGSRFLH
jgi:hypothetical protein